MRERERQREGKILKEGKKRRGLSTQHFLFSLSILNIRRRFFLLSMKIISNLIKTIKSNLIYKLQLKFFFYKSRYIKQIMIYNSSINGIFLYFY